MYFSRAISSIGRAGQGIQSFVRMVAGRSMVSLLVETTSAAEQLPDCLSAGRIDEVHVGLNDLSIQLGCAVTLEPISTGVVDGLAATLRGRLPFGVGGIGRLSCETLPVDPERLLAEQVRLGCSRGWLGRTFRDGLHGARLAAEVVRVRETIARWASASDDACRENRRALVDEILAWRASVTEPC